MRSWIILIAIALLALPACDESDEADNGEETQQEETEEGDDDGDEAEEGDEDGDEEAAAEPEPVEGRIAISLELDEEQQEAAEELVNGFRGSRFDHDQIDGKNALFFLDMAAENDNNYVVAGALHAMSQVFQPAHLLRDDDEDRLAVDEDYVTVVAAHLNSDNDQVLSNAIRASRSVLRDEEVGYDAVLPRLLEMATGPRPEVAYEVVEILTAVHDGAENEEVIAAYVEVLNDSEPHIMSRALFRLRHISRVEDAADELWDPVLAATEHDDPGVRGRAIELLARLPGWGFSIDEERAQVVGERAVEMFEDENPFVRSRAAGATASVDYVEAVPHLLELIDDHQRNTYDLEGWTQLDGRSGRLHHDGSAWSRVSDAALRALSQMRFDDRDMRFEYDSPSFGSDEEMEEQLSEQADRARAWFEENQAGIEEGFASQ